MILFFIIGLGLIALGIFAKVHSDRMHKLGITYAVVRDCLPATKTIGETEIPCNRLTLEVLTAYGVVCKEVLDNEVYQVGDTVKIFYDPTEDSIELCKNVSEKGSVGPYLLMGFGALICVLLLCSATNFFGLLDGDNTSAPGKIAELQLNEKGYSTEFVNLREDEKYSEYFYTPADTKDTYAYNIRIYHCGIGVVLIFPLESQGKGFNQSFAFYPDSADLKQIKKDAKKYDFEQLAESKQPSSTAEGVLDHEYLYYYNGSERIGSGGYGVEGEDFDTVVEHLKNAVPQEVWEAVKDEVWGYYE